MSKIIALATVTLREVLRRKVQVNLLLFGGVLVIASYALSLLTIGDMRRIISDLGLAAMEGIGTLLAVFLGASLVAGDMERRILYPVVAKPVSRTQYILGRYFGLAVALTLNVAIMGVLLTTVVLVGSATHPAVDGTFLAAFAFIAIQLVVVAAVAVLFSCITNSTLAAIFTLSVVVAGHLSNDMRAAWHASNRWIAMAVWYALPNLGSLSLNREVVYRLAVPRDAWIAALYGALYTCATLALASAVFERRDFR